MPLDIAGKRYSVDYRAGSNIGDVAREFCVRNAADFGITTNEQIPNCAGPVAEFLTSQATPKASPPTVVDVRFLHVPLCLYRVLIHMTLLLQIPLTIAGKKYVVQYAPNGVVSVQDTAKIFCVQNAASLGLTQDSELPGCIAPVAEYLGTAVSPQRTQQPRMITVRMERWVGDQCPSI